MPGGKARLPPCRRGSGAPAESDQVRTPQEKKAQITQALIDRSVIPDFRAPDTIRLGLSPLYTTFTEVWDAVEAIADVVESEAYRNYPAEPEGVT